jgi:hypothetical protein
MNTRQAKKIGCYPCDPHRKPRETTPYTDAQLIESGRIFRRALERGDRNGRVKWGSPRPHVYRARWQPGFTGAAHYGPKAQRVQA